MASPAAIPDDLSTFGKSSLRPQLDLQPPQVPDHSDSVVDRAVADLLGAAFDGDIPRARKPAKKLVKAGKGVDEAVAAVGDPGSRRRHWPLHLGAAAGKVEMCRFLIKDFQADVDATDGEGFYEVAELLLSEGADVDPICENGGAPVHIAAKNGHAKVLNLLLQNKADSDRFSPSFNTPLVASLFGSSVECLEVLLEAGADVNAGNPVTPLIVAARKGLTDCIKYLLEDGANADIPDENGKMPVEVAVLKGQEECVKLIFPVTTPLPEYADWSVDGIIQHGKNVRLRQAYKIKAEGDAACRKKDYQLASSRYTLALVMDPDDPTMYAKRSLCFQHMNDRESALADANAYRDMQLDRPEPCSEDEEEGAALKLVEEYSRGIEALMSGLNLGPGNGPSDKESSTKEEEAAAAAAAAAATAGPRRSTRSRKPNTRFSGPEWAT